MQTCHYEFFHLLVDKNLSVAWVVADTYVVPDCSTIYQNSYSGKIVFYLNEITLKGSISSAPFSKQNDNMAFFSVVVYKSNAQRKYM